jgi:hypothetical protein
MAETAFGWSIWVVCGNPDLPAGAADPGHARASLDTAMPSSTQDPQLDPADITDELPADLNAAEYVGPYQFPDNDRRRKPALLYVVVGAAMFGTWLAARSGDGSSLVNRGFALGGLFLLALGLYGWVAGSKLAVHETDALAAASTHVGFPVGHASAQLGWRGLLSRPTWRILLYSAENPPAMRGLVLVDGVDRRIVGDLVEDNPEDWSQYDE